MRAVSLAFSVAKMSLLDFSGKLVKKWTSDDTMVSVGRMLNLLLDSCSFGKSNSASKNVLTTFTVMVDSLPATDW